MIAYVRQTTGHYTEALDLIAGVMLLGAIVPFMIRSSRVTSGTTLVPPRAPQPGLR